MPVSRDRVSPLKLSPRRLYFDTDSPPGGSVSEYIRPPGDYILKQSLRGRENISSPVEINSPPGECLFRHELGYSLITFIGNQSTVFWLIHLCLNYALFSSRNSQYIKQLAYNANRFAIK